MKELSADKHPSIIVIFLFLLLLLLSRGLDAQCVNASGSTGTCSYAPFDRCGNGCKSTLTMALSDCAGRPLKVLQEEPQAGLSTVETPLEDVAPGHLFLKASFDKTGYSSTHKVIKH